MKPKNKVHKVMHEFKEGTLKSHGKVVIDRKQAIAIALNSAGLSNKKVTGGMITVLPFMFKKGGLIDWLNEPFSLKELTS